MAAADVPRSSRSSQELWWREACHRRRRGPPVGHARVGNVTGYSTELGDFPLVAAGAAAALSGLVFVAVSVNIRPTSDVVEAVPSHRKRPDSTKDAIAWGPKGFCGEQSGQTSPPWKSLLHRTLPR